MSAASDDRQLDPARVAERQRAGDLQVVDVRTDAEWHAGHIAGSVHVPFDELTRRVEELDRSRALVLVCHSGNRSAAAAEAFAASGWEAFSMAGGLAAWEQEGLPLEPEGGRVEPMSGIPA